MATNDKNKKKSIEDLLKTLENDEEFLELLSCDDIQGVQKLLSEAIAKLEGGDIIAQVKVLKVDQDGNPIDIDLNEYDGFRDTSFDVIDEALQRIGDVDLAKVQHLKRHDYFGEQKQQSKSGLKQESKDNQESQEKHGKSDVAEEKVTKKDIKKTVKAVKVDKASLNELIEQVLDTETTQQEDIELSGTNYPAQALKDKLIHELLECNRDFDNPLDIRVMYESEQFCLMNIAGQPLNGHIATVLSRHLSNKQLQKEYQLRPNEVLKSLIEQENIHLSIEEKKEQERHLSLYYGVELLDKKNKNTLFLEQEIAQSVTEKLWTILSSQSEQDDVSFEESDEFLAYYMTQLGKPLKIQ
jgi:hypothetical protein